jgi:hypothetical protein
MRVLIITLLALVWMPHANAGNYAIDYLKTTPASKLEVGLLRMNVWLLQKGQQNTTAELKDGRIVIRYEFEGDKDEEETACNKLSVLIGYCYSVRAFPQVRDMQ